MNSATAQKLRWMVPNCPNCNSTLARHQFAELATTVCEEQNQGRITEFIEYARTRQWTHLREFQEFKGDKDDLIAKVIACGERGVLIVMKSFVELYASDELPFLEVINQDDIRALRSLIDADRWYPIND